MKSFFSISIRLNIVLNIIIGTFIFLSPLFAKTYWGSLDKDIPLERGRLNSPPGVYKKLLNWINPFDSSNYCLIYKTPYKKEGGQLLLRKYKRTIEKKKEKKCQLKGKYKESIFKKNIQHINLLEKENHLGKNIQLVLQLKPSSPRSNQTRAEQVINMHFPLSSSKKKRWPLLSISQNRSHSSHEKKRSIKKRNILNNGDYCLSQNKNCKRVLSKCNECPFPEWTQVLNYKRCPRKPIGICGLSQCGNRLQQACLKMTALKERISCEEAKLFVTCAPNLTPYCQGTGEIICR